MQHFKAELSLGRWNGGGEKGFHLEIRDRISGTVVLTADFDDATYVDLVTSLNGGNTASATLHTDQFERIGKVYQRRVETIPGITPGTFGAASTLVEGYRLKHSELLGWSYTLDKKWNHHNQDKDGYRVTFYRYVEPDFLVEGDIS